MSSEPRGATFQQEQSESPKAVRGKKTIRVAAFFQVYDQHSPRSMSSINSMTSTRLEASAYKETSPYNHTVIIHSTSSMLPTSPNLPPSTMIAFFHEVMEAVTQFWSTACLTVAPPSRSFRMVELILQLFPRTYHLTGGRHQPNEDGHHHKRSSPSVYQWSQWSQRSDRVPEPVSRCFSRREQDCVQQACANRNHWYVRAASGWRIEPSKILGDVLSTTQSLVEDTQGPVQH